MRYHPRGIFTILPACLLLFRLAPVAAGESPYNPGAKPAPPKLAYFCTADTWDHSAYYITPAVPAPQPYDPTFEGKASGEWEQYMVQLHGKRVIAYPHCAVGNADEMPATVERFKQSQRQVQPRVPIVEVSWHAGMTVPAATGGPTGS